MKERKIRWKELVTEVANSIGGKRMLARRVRVDEREVRRWTNDTNAPEPQGEHAAAILEDAIRLGINPRKYSGLEPVYDFRKSFEENVAEGPQGFSSNLDNWFPKIPTPLFDISLNSPLGIPSSVLTTNSDWIKPLSLLGFDVITAKTVRTKPLSAHGFPNCAYLSDLRAPSPVGSLPNSTRGIPGFPEEDVAKISMANSFGVPSPDPQEWQADLGKTLSFLKPGQILIASIVGTGENLIADFVKCAQLAWDVKPFAIELNLSCPNVYGKEGSVYQDPKISGTICERIRKEIPTAKILLKIGYLPSRQLSEFFGSTQRYVDGYTAINTIPAKITGEGQKEGGCFFPGSGRAKAGISGVAIREYAIQTVRNLRRLADEAKRSEIAIIGVGGVSSLEDVNRFREAGANCVQICTAALLNPSIGAEIRNKLPRGDNALGYSRILQRAGVSPPFQDRAVAQAFDSLVEVCNEEKLDFDLGWKVLKDHWLDGYVSDLRALQDSPGHPQKTRREGPSKPQIRDWLRNALKS